MRLVFIIRRLSRGGAERQLVELVRHLDKTVFEVSVVTLYPGGALWDEASAIPGVRLGHLGKRGRWHAGPLVELLRFFRNTRPDVVHGYMDVANLLALGARPVGAKVVWGIRASRVDTSCYDYARRASVRIEAWLARAPDLIICNSAAARNDACARGFPTDRTIMIPNGIDTGRFRPDPASRAETRARWRVSAREFLIGLIGRLDPMKGHSVFIAAAGMLAERHRNARFVLIGDGALRQQLQEHVDGLGLRDRMIWAGERKDMAAVIPALDLSVSASLFGEGFSNAIGESMACEVPCVATDVGDAARILGGLGWLAPPGDHVTLAARISEAMQSCLSGAFRRELIRERVETEFGVKRLAQTTGCALRGLHDGSRRA